MGMYGHVRQITPAELERLQRSPSAVTDLIRADVEAKGAKAKAIMLRMQDFAREVQADASNTDRAELEKRRAQMLQELQDAVKPDSHATDGNGLSLDKSWHVLHYLLTGELEEAAPPLGNAILGGKEIGEDLGYGPARFLTPQQVREVSTALAAISKDDLIRRFDLTEAPDLIYPSKDSSELGLAQEYFEQLSNYYANAAASGNAMLLYIE